MRYKKEKIREGINAAGPVQLSATARWTLGRAGERLLSQLMTPREPKQTQPPSMVLFSAELGSCLARGLIGWIGCT